MTRKRQKQNHGINLIHYVQRLFLTDCLIDVVSIALDNRTEYPSRESSAWLALRNLHARLKEEYDKAFV